MYMKKEKICGIYKITNPKEHVYIGLSDNIFVRWDRAYRRYGCASQPKLYNSLKKYGWENHTFEIIHVCEYDELNQWEAYYGKLYGTPGPMGLNLRECGGNYGKWSEEVKLKIMENHWTRTDKATEIINKISLAHKGKNLSEEHKENISKGLILAERTMSPENLALLMASRIGSHHTDESKKLISIGNTGKKRTQEVKDMISRMLMEGICGRKGIPTSDATKLLLRNIQLGSKRSEECKKKMSEDRSGEKNHFFGKTHTEENKKIISEKAKIRFSVPTIGKYDTNGYLITTYNTGHELSLKLGHGKTWFSAMINSKYHNGILLIDGFVYKYL